MANFINIEKDTVLLWLREKKAVYAPIPARLNRNKDDVSAKAIFVETENRFAPFLVCEHCEKVFSWYKQQSDGKWKNLSGLSTVKLHQKTSCDKSKSKSASALTPLINRALQAADRDVRRRKPLPPNEKKLWRNCVVDCLSEHPTVSINAFAQLTVHLIKTGRFFGQTNDKRFVLFLSLKVQAKCAL
jgi:hypothetical protein